MFVVPLHTQPLTPHQFPETLRSAGKNPSWELPRCRCSKMFLAMVLSLNATVRACCYLGFSKHRRFVQSSLKHLSISILKASKHDCSPAERQSSNQCTKRFLLILLGRIPDFPWNGAKSDRRLLWYVPKLSESDWIAHIVMAGRKPRVQVRSRNMSMLQKEGLGLSRFPSEPRGGLSTPLVLFIISCMDRQFVLFKLCTSWWLWCNEKRRYENTQSDSFRVRHTPPSL